VSAYEVVALLAEQGHHLSAAQAYRTLQRLVASDDVVRVETLNAYRPTQRFGEPNGPVLFCQTCGCCTRASAAAFAAELIALSKSASFKTTRFVVEIAGICPSCQEDTAVDCGLRHAG
jgi:Fur family zinc uptake transcriptional regulator